MSLAHLLLDFFNDGKRAGGSLFPYSLLDFVNKYPEWGHRVHQVTSYCRKLENEHLLNHMGTTAGPNPFYVHHYYTNKAIYDTELSVYGSYDLLVEGFLSVRNKLSSIVLPISVLNCEEDFSIGTSFVFSEDTVITAKHCIEGKKKVSLLGLDGSAYAVNKVFYPKDDKLDIAIIKLASPNFSKYPTITISRKEEWRGVGEMDEINILGEKSIIIFAPGKILDDVLTLGFPPISGFESVIIADKSSINSKYFRSSEGHILGYEQKYTDSIEYLLINARVKGGNSGGPVIDKLGRVIGMIVQMPNDIQNPEELDKLGYGLAIPSKYLNETLTGVKSGDGSVIEVEVYQLGGNSFSVQHH